MDFDWLEKEGNTVISVFESHSKVSKVMRSNECGGYTVRVVEKWTAKYVNDQYVNGATVAQVT